MRSLFLCTALLSLALVPLCGPSLCLIAVSSVPLVYVELDLCLSVISPPSPSRSTHKCPQGLHQYKGALPPANEKLRRRLALLSRYCEKSPTGVSLKHHMFKLAAHYCSYPSKILVCGRFECVFGCLFGLEKLRRSVFISAIQPLWSNIVFPLYHK